MSLAPAERRALHQIEDSLRHSDPRLARMLTQFTVPLARGGLVFLVRRSRRTRMAIWSAVVVVTLAVLVLAGMHRPATPVPCAGPNTAVPAAAGPQATTCPPARQSAP